MIVHPERNIAAGLVPRESEMAMMVVDERRQPAIALRGGHRPAEQEMAEPRGFGECRGDVGVSYRQFLGDDGTGQLIGARAAVVLGERQGPQAKLRSLVEQRHGQPPIAGVEPVGLEHDRLDLLRNKVAHGVANFQLFGAQMQTVHGFLPS